MFCFQQWLLKNLEEYLPLDVCILCFSSFRYETFFVLCDLQLLLLQSFISFRLALSVSLSLSFVFPFFRARWLRSSSLFSLWMARKGSGKAQIVDDRTSVCMRCTGDLFCTCVHACVWISSLFGNEWMKKNRREETINLWFNSNTLKEGGNRFFDLWWIINLNKE